jgi:serine O-acetyltransferase
MGIASCFTRDLRSNGRKVPGPIGLMQRFMFNAGYRVVVLYRVAMLLRQSRLPLRIGRFLALVILSRLARVPGVEINTKYPIGDGLHIGHPHDIVIGGGARIGRNVIIYNGVTLGSKGPDDNVDIADRFPEIGDDVTIYPGAKIIGNVKIGARSTVGANSVVLKSFDEDSVIAGVPARLIRKGSG